MRRLIWTSLAVALVGAGLGLAAPATAQFDGGGGGGSGSSDGDWAIRTELQNPRAIKPGSPYGYDRTYSRGPNWEYPPAYELGPAPRRAGGRRPRWCAKEGRTGLLLTHLAMRSAAAQQSRPPTRRSSSICRVRRAS
jgi:hypothetical protein